jgi:hypothetical protein
MGILFGLRGLPIFFAGAGVGFFVPRRTSMTLADQIAGFVLVVASALAGVATLRFLPHR